MNFKSVQASISNADISTEVSEETIIRLTDINKTFYVAEKQYDSIMEKALNLFKPQKQKEIKALTEINLEIKRGEFLGVIGKNGSGKSTLLKIMTGAFPPDKGGKVEINGRLIRLSLGIGFDANLTARENIYVNGSIIGLTFKKIGQKFDDIIEFADLRSFVDTPVKFFSSGMVTRLAFAIAIHAEADILLLDEFFGGVGDEDFRLKSDKAFKDFIKNDKTIILVTHNLSELKTYAHRVIHIQEGEIVDSGDPEKVIQNYLNNFS